MIRDFLWLWSEDNDIPVFNRILLTPAIFLLLFLRSLLHSVDVIICWLWNDDDDSNGSGGAMIPC